MKHHFLAAFAAATALTHGVHGQTSTLMRPYDPLVLTGAQLPAFLGSNPDVIVGFRYSAGNWQQIPVQVDERVLLDLVRPYGPSGIPNGPYQTSPGNPKVLFYADTKTEIGPDSNPNFDANDELVFMVNDAGGQAPAGSAPSGIVAGSLREVQMTDPLGGQGSVYLAKSAGSLQPGAGAAYVTVSTNLVGTAGFPVNNAPNPENTLVQTPRYRWRQTAEWVTEVLRIRVGNDVDILDRHKNFFLDNQCVRTENTFSDAENAFETAIVGPVRAIRSVMGANSGITTERRHFFYGGRVDVQSILRVHAIPGIHDVFDYNQAASGMTYRNNLNPGGVTIDGSPDNVTKGDIAWEQVSGTPGTLSILLNRATTIGASEATFTSYYDDTAVGANHCTGDSLALGTSGVKVLFDQGVSVCTDPIDRCKPEDVSRMLTLQRTLYFDAPAAADTTAKHYRAQYDAPLQLGGSALAAARPQAISDEDRQLAFALFPNPSSGTVTLRTGQDAQVRVYNALGQLVLSRSVAAGDTPLVVPGKGLQLVVVTQGGTQIAQHLLVQ